MAKERSPQELRQVFSDNLKELSARAVSVSELCRELGMNRSQFNRYLHGEAHPRPDVLDRICRYFDVDARVLTEPLAELAGSQPRAAERYLDDILDNSRRPASDAVIPDGLYGEWSIPLLDRTKVQFYVMRVHTEDGIRKTKVVVKPLRLTDDERRGGARQRYLCEGFLFHQPTGFAQLDMVRGLNLLTMTSYLPGFIDRKQAHFGVKHFSSSISTLGAHGLTACVLEQLDVTQADLQALVRRSHLLAPEEAPRYAVSLLKEICEINFAALAEPYGGVSRSR